MLKRKYGDRSGWKRIIERKYSQTYMESREFIGHITLLHLVQVSEPLWVNYGEKNICIVDNGYMWLQHYPIGKNYSVTSMFDASGEIVQWYIDICYEIGIEHNVPWLDDLFLDIVVLANGEIILLDEDELEEALENGSIDKAMYNLAWDEANRITDLIKEKTFKLLPISQIHKKTLEEQLR
ncbi:DUF402 domain-containing protein [Psychrobacillus sp.]|uniref:DUF402 domain-containing protein n=1 Tax=Psychrobacillus sp. TaxID=1871623 RepID=UPI0028BDB4E9|nr:DUF402 domain-containing protein [Psychrobacillus sp.]